jgi:hypothetical protein
MLKQVQHDMREGDAKSKIGRTCEREMLKQVQHDMRERKKEKEKNYFWTN